MSQPRKGTNADEGGSREGFAVSLPGRMARWRTQRGSALSHALAWISLLIVYGAVALGVGVLLITRRPYRLPAVESYLPSTVYASDGTVLARFADERRIPIHVQQLPARVIEAVLAAEDTHFYTHHGLDWRGILRAAWVDLCAGRFAQGGSTITQQLVRLDVLDDRRSVRRKIHEMVLALRVEHAYRKDEILERYLNAVYFGGGAYGIGAAAEIYFGKSAARLTPAESALLAGSIRQPGEGDPRYHFDIARGRQQAILAAMQRHGWLTRDAYQVALVEPLHIHPRPRSIWRAPYVVEAVREDLLDRYGRDVVYQDGLAIYTTVKVDLQQTAEQALRHVVAAGRSQHVGNGALVALDPHSGEIRALVGGTDFTASQFNRALQAHRQPGSAFKAFVYQAAIDNGHLLSDQALDAPVTAGDWSPENFGAHYHGKVTLETALALSLNSVSVRLVKEVSPYAVITAAINAGISSPLRPTMAIALGAYEVTPLEMARAFATYAAGGKTCHPALIREIRRGQTVIWRRRASFHQSVSPATAFLLTQGLRAVIARGTGRQADIGRPAAGKTGTSNDFRDAWFIGYTPDLCAAVWVGNDDRRPMRGVVGGSLPAQAWAAFMREALRGYPATNFPIPTGIANVKICTASNELALPTCPIVVQRYLPSNRVPGLCQLHYWVTRRVCAETGLLPNPTCPHAIQRFAYDQLPTQVCPIHHQPIESLPQPDTNPPASGNGVGE